MSWQQRRRLCSERCRAHVFLICFRGTAVDRRDRRHARSGSGVVTGDRGNFGLPDTATSGGIIILCSLIVLLGWPSLRA